MEVAEPWIGLATGITETIDRKNGSNGWKADVGLLPLRQREQRSEAEQGNHYNA